MKDEQRITVSIDCLCLCIWLNSAHVRGTSFFFLAKWRWPQGRTKRRLLSVFYSVSVLSHNTANLCSGTRGVETNEGLPMWKWFPHRPVRALVLISGNELWLEKLSSGRQAGSDGAAAEIVLPWSNRFNTEAIDLPVRRIQLPAAPDPKQRGSEADTGQGGETFTEMAERTWKILYGNM